MNICKSEYGTQIFCSHPSSEFKDVTQLLLDSNKFECGYLAESFVRPPVFILVSWSHCYRVNRVLFKPSFGRHIIEKMSVRCIPKNALCDTISHENYKSIINKFKGIKQDVFINLTSSTGHEIVEINFLSEYRKSNSSCNVFNLIRNNIGYLLLEIISMKNTSLPCLSGLRIYSVVKRKVVNEVALIELPSDKKFENDFTSLVSTGTDDSAFYPDDCVDPLTAELLDNPVKLPCGKHINLNTLLRCWASKPVDFPKYNPFTMMPLTDSQIHTSTVPDLEKKRQVATQIREFQRKKDIFYDTILHPKKKYVPYESQLENGHVSDSDDDQLSDKLNDNINKNFAFLLNKQL